MSVTNHIDLHLTNASRALQERRYDDFEFYLRSLSLFSEEDKRQYHMERISKMLARNHPSEVESEWLLMQELLALGGAYTEYLQEVAPVFGHRGKDDTRLGRVLLHFDKLRKAEELRKHLSRDRQDARDRQDERLKRFGKGNLGVKFEPAGIPEAIAEIRRFAGAAASSEDAPATLHDAGVEVAKMLATVVERISEFRKGIVDQIERGQQGAA